MHIGIGASKWPRQLKSNVGVSIAPVVGKVLPRVIGEETGFVDQLEHKPYFRLESSVLERV